MTRLVEDLRSTFTYDEIPWRAEDAASARRSGRDLDWSGAEGSRPILTPKYDGHWAMVLDGTHVFLAEMCHTGGFHRLAAFTARNERTPSPEQAAQLRYWIFDTVTSPEVRALAYSARLALARRHLRAGGGMLTLLAQRSNTRGGSPEQPWIPATGLRVRAQVVETVEARSLAAAKAQARAWAMQDDKEGGVLTSDGAAYAPGALVRYKLKPYADAEMVVEGVVCGSAHDPTRITSLRGTDPSDNARVNVRGTDIPQLPEAEWVGKVVTYVRRFAESARRCGIYKRVRTDDRGAAIEEAAAAASAAAESADEETHAPRGAHAASGTQKRPRKRAKTAKQAPVKSPEASRSLELLAKYYNCRYEGVDASDHAQVSACMRRAQRSSSTRLALRGPTEPCDPRYCAGDEAWGDNGEARLRTMLQVLQGVCARRQRTAAANGTLMLLTLPPEDPVRRHLLAGKVIRVRSSRTPEDYLIKCTSDTAERRGPLSVCYVPAVSCSCKSFKFGNSDGTKCVIQESRARGVSLVREKCPPSWLRTCKHVETVLDPQQRGAAMRNQRIVLEDVRAADLKPERTATGTGASSSSLSSSRASSRSNMELLILRSQDFAAKTPGLLRTAAAAASPPLRADEAERQEKLWDKVTKVQRFARADHNVRGATAMHLLASSAQEAMLNDDAHAKRALAHLHGGGAFEVRGGSDRYTVRIAVDPRTRIAAPTCTCPSFTKPNNKHTLNLCKTDALDTVPLKPTELPDALRVCKHLHMVLQPDPSDNRVRRVDGDGSPVST
jgi:hypothetical protein